MATSNMGAPGESNDQAALGAVKYSGPFPTAHQLAIMSANDHCVVCTKTAEYFMAERVWCEGHLNKALSAYYDKFDGQDPVQVFTLKTPMVEIVHWPMRKQE